jgi:MOSC domain-containing protein YiiM
MGKTLAIGETRLHVHTESKPCNIMDQQHQGLRAALKSEWRGGVIAEVLVGGTVRVGDGLRVVADDANGDDSV